MDRAREREREGRGGGSRVSDSGIRQLGQASWLEADLIVCLSLRHFAVQEERFSLTNWCHRFYHFSILS